MKKLIHLLEERAGAAGLWLVLLLLLTGCAPATQITGTWKSPQATGTTYNSIIVVALTDNTVTRQTMEAQLQSFLQQRGVTATKSIDVFPPAMMREGKTSGDDLLANIKAKGHDAILTVALVDRETETRYVPGTVSYMPMSSFGWYGSFRGYYNYYRPTMFNPGYYQENKIYFLETNLYDAGTENLLWSAQTESYNPTSLSKVAEKFAETTVSRLQQEGLIK